MAYYRRFGNFSGRNRSSGGSGGGQRSGGFGGRRNGPTGQYINPAKFIRKAVVHTEANAVVITNRFSDFGFSKQVNDNIIFKKYDIPTPIQDQTIKPIMAGRDMIGIANTGTGKTAAFLLPLIDKVYKDRNQKVLIITPTRELAIQIEEEFRQFAFGMQMYSAICIGGAPMGRQISALRRHPNFVIGTPGRIKDHVGRHYINLHEFNNIVLDEVDRMLDMGFVDEIRLILQSLAKPRQSLFFSATLPPRIETLCKEFLVNPLTVSVKVGDTADNVDQNVIKINHSIGKFTQLVELLHGVGFDKVLIFGRTKHGVERLADDLVAKGFKAESIHGNKNQNRRERAIRAFKTGTVNILVATDVAARGLDIPNVSHVINYDIPSTFEDYTHRIGRTGRADKMGIALTFVG